MTLFERLQAVFILLSMALGLALGQIPGLGAPAGRLIVPFLMLMLTGVFLHVPLRGLAEAFSNRRFTAWNLGLNFLWVPVFCWLLGRVFLAEQPDLRVGLLMLLVTPCTDWYLVFTQLTGGNVRLAASQLPWHLVLQLLLLPLYLLVFAGMLVPMNVGLLLESVLLMLMLPLVLATLIRAVARWTRGQVWFEQNMLPWVPPTQSIFLLLAIMAMFASQGSTLLTRFDVVAWLFPPLMVFYVVSLALGQAVGRWAGFDGRDSTALCFATLCRNSPMSLAIAVVVFPDRPLIALALVIEPLIELPIVALISQVLRRSRQSRSDLLVA